MLFIDNYVPSTLTQPGLKGNSARCYYYSLLVPIYHKTALDHKQEQVWGVAVVPTMVSVHTCPNESDHTERKKSPKSVI